MYFKHIPKNIISDRLQFIVDSEKITVSENLLNQITDKSDGDLRKSINLLELVLLLSEDMLDYVFIDNTIDQSKINNLCSYAKKKN